MDNKGANTGVPEIIFLARNKKNFNFNRKKMENNNNHLSFEAAQYEQIMSEGHDFLKIHIYKLALKKYQKALATGFNDELSNQMINECKRLITSESKILRIIFAIALVVAATLLILL